MPSGWRAILPAAGLQPAFSVHSIVAVILPAVFLSACGGLPANLRDQIAAERDRLPQAQRELDRTKQSMRDAAADPSIASAWSGRLASAQTELGRAKKDGAELDRLEKGGQGKDSRAHAQSLIADERSEREAALNSAEAVERDANHWADFRRNTPHYLAALQDEYEKLHAFDLAPVTARVRKAEQDWPAKKSDLESRLGLLQKESEDADSVWRSIDTARGDAAAGKATGPEIAQLIAANDTFYTDVDLLTRGANEVDGLTGQLYNAWDKVLTDLDKGRDGQDTVYRERVKTVTTHFTDVAAKKTDVTSNEAWLDVSASGYKSVENDLGMAIAHKDAGLYDSEAQTTPQPAGFAYIAPPSVGSNQYGYWSHADGGSVWTWLPAYLIMRDMFWGPGYRPIIINEYNGYEVARRYGRTYYGQDTPSAPPRYGSHGTITEQRYGSSRYVQSGGYASSRYATHPGESRPPSVGDAPRGFGQHAEPDSGAGRKFGSGSGAESAGKRFGSGSGSPSSGRRFGSGGGSRSVGRSFGRRR